MDTRERRERGQGRNLNQLMPEHEETLPPDAATAADHRNPRRRNNGSNGETADLGVLVTPQPHHALDNLVLHADVRDDIAAGLRAIQRRADLETFAQMWMSLTEPVSDELRGAYEMSTAPAISPPSH